tara:strand:+ start:388 stop:759 length:372 start_codon:yes stop_codon:yes gene_type:complete
MSTIKANTLLAADGSTTTQPSIPALDKRMAKAWVNFNGTGTVAIRDDYGVSSITDYGTGDFNINFSTNMSNNSYTFSCAGSYVTIGSVNAQSEITTSALRLRTTDGAGNNGDKEFVCVQIFSS